MATAILYTGDELIETIKTRVAVPNTQATGTADADLLRLVNEEMKTEIVPFVIRHMEDYLVVTEEISLVSSTNLYRIPSRAVGQKLRELKYKASSSDREVDLSRVSREWANRYAGSSGAPTGFYLEGNHIRLVPDIGSATGSLVVSYFFRPGDIVTESDVRIVSSVSGKQVTATAALPSGWVSGSKFDIHSPESGAEIKAWGLTVDTISTPTITFNEDIDGSTRGTKAVAAGDYLCLENEAALPALPKELHPILALSACLSVAELLGDLDAIKYLEKSLNRKMVNANSLLEDRVEGENQKIGNPGSILWQQGGYPGIWGV
jgi:hypothetical protein